MKKILFIASVIGLLVVLFFTMCPSIEDVQGKEFKLEKYEVLKNLELNIAEINAQGQGIYGYKKRLVNVPIVDTVEMCWDCPGSRYVKIDGVTTIKLGYNAKAGQKIFKNCVGTIREDRKEVVIELKGEFQPPYVTAVIPKNFATQSASWFSGDIPFSEWEGYMKEVGQNVAIQVAGEKESELISIYQSAVTEMMAGMLQPVFGNKKLTITFTINNTPYTNRGLNETVKVIDKNNVDYGKTHYEDYNQ